VTLIAVMRAVKIYREKRTRGFYEVRRVRGKAVVLPEVVEKAQALWQKGRRWLKC
jgi:hypothetical protein